MSAVQFNNWKTEISNQKICVIQSILRQGEIFVAGLIT